MQIQLSIVYKNKQHEIALDIQNKGDGMFDYILTHKNGYTFYVFRKESGIWKLVYGVLDPELASIILQALAAAIDNPSDQSPEL